MFVGYSNRSSLQMLLAFIFSSLIFGYGHAQMNVDSLERAMPLIAGSKRINALNHLAAYYSSEQPEKSLAYASDALKLAQEAGESEQEAAALRYMADSYYYLDNLTEAVKYYKESAQICLELWGPTSEAYIGRIGDVAYCYDMMNEYAIAIDYYQQNVENARSGEHAEEVAANLANIGRIYTIWGDYGKALDYMEEALELDRASGDQEVLASDYNTIGKIFSNWGEQEKAIEYFSKSLKINEELNMPDKVAIRLNSIGDAYRAMKQYESALDYFNRALEIDRKLNNELQMGVRYTNIASVYIDMGQLEKARAYLVHAESIFRKYNDILNLVFALVELGRVEFMTGNLNKAVEHLEEGYSMADTKNLKHQKAAIQGLLAKVFEEKGFFKEAYRCQVRHDSIEDLIFTEENARQMSSFQARHEVQQARQMAELLKKDKRIQRKTMLISSIILSAVVLLLTFGVVIFRMRSVFMKQQREIADRKAEGFQQELELRNKELALSAMNIIRNNESMMQVANLIKSTSDENDSSERIRNALQSLKSMEHDRNWEEFEMRITQVYGDFYRKLDERFPSLTPNERKLCAFLKLNMSTKEIASITRQSIKSINVARSRLRKKLGIDHTDENIISFLSRI